MFNFLQVFALAPDSPEDEADRLATSLAEVGATMEGVQGSAAGRTLPRALNGGDLMWRLSFTTESEFRTAVASRQWRERVSPLLSPDRVTVLDRIAYRTALSDVSSGRAQPGIWRCLALSVDAGTPRDEIRQFERDLTSMPRHVSTIRNWSMGQVVSQRGRRQWTHVWEQEFDDMAGLEGEYMMHPIHWGLVDGWFDPECPQRIVDPLLIHAAFRIEGATIL